MFEIPRQFQMDQDHRSHCQLSEKFALMVDFPNAATPMKNNLFTSHIRAIDSFTAVN
jgi:hypothetical protein